MTGILSSIPLMSQSHPQRSTGYVDRLCTRSTPEQNLNLQRDALQKAGCERIFTDVASGAQAERQGWPEALAFARPGNVIVVWKLDRFGRSLRHLIEAIHRLESRQIGFRSLQENLDTTTSGGKLLLPCLPAK